jgi:hypothetical protein
MKPFIWRCTLLAPACGLFLITLAASIIDKANWFVFMLAYPIAYVFALLPTLIFSWIVAKLALEHQRRGYIYTVLAAIAVTPLRPIPVALFFGLLNTKDKSEFEGIMILLFMVVVSVVTGVYCRYILSDYLREKDAE